MLVGLIGHPVAHSKSPLMQNAAFAHAGLHDWHYELWDTPLADVPARMAMIRERSNIAGCNVTIPHKQNVMPHLDSISEHARAIGAVNTVYKPPPPTSHRDVPPPPHTREGRLVGDNTDWIGWLHDVQWHGVEMSQIKRALVLGAGGSARAIVYALAQCGAAVTIMNRDAERAVKLAADFGAASAGLNEIAAVARDAQPQLIVNCTSAGMWPNDDTTPWPDDAPFPAGAVLYDLVYKPRVTRLMMQAERAGARAIGGIGMLAEQGAAAFEKWTGVPPAQVSAIMRDALKDA
jgi:shikimate dehydrogenase